MVILAALVIGYGVGTLLAVFLDRLYTGAPVRGRPRLCDGAPLPLVLWTGTLGFGLLRGRRPGGGRLPARFWYLPVLGAAAGVMIARNAVNPWHSLLLIGFSTVLLAFVGTDFERHLLPNRLMYPTIAAAAALWWVWPSPDQTVVESAVSHLGAGLLGFGVMFLLFVVMPGFGFGDVKLVGLTGLLVGLSNLLPALLIGALAAGIASAVMLAFRRAGLKTFIAYGPYLVLGAFAGMLI